jgi:RNA polymerase sigma-70 factor
MSSGTSLFSEAYGRVARAWAWYRPGPDFEAAVARAASELGPEELSLVHWEDLALLDGFRRGMPQAAAVMHGTIGARLVEVLVKKGAEPTDADDLLQERLCGLLEQGAASYSGRGSLIGWLRTCLVRDLGKLREHRLRQKRSPHLTPSSLVLPDAESALAAHHHRPHLRAALRSVFASLEPEGRRILRLTHVGGLTAQQVAALLGLHRVTVQKKLGELRREIDRRTRKELARRFGLDRSTISALLDPHGRSLDTSLSSMLASAPVT